MTNDLVNANHYKTELDYAREVGKLIVKSGKWSKDWNEDTVAVLVLYARDLGIHPVKALMNGFDIIQGKISMKPILMSDMIRRAGHSIQIVQNDAQACILKGKRKDNGDTCQVQFTIDDAKKAKLAGKDNYNSWTSDMLYSRAMGRLARMLFSDVIGGAYTTEEADDIKHKSKPEDLQTVQNEVETVEVPKVEHIPDINELTATLLMKFDTDVAMPIIADFVKLMSVKHSTSEANVIRSAFANDENMKRFNDALLKSLEPSTPEPEAA